MALNACRYINIRRNFIRLTINLNFIDKLTINLNLIDRLSRSVPAPVGATESKSFSKFLIILTSIRFETVVEHRPRHRY